MRPAFACSILFALGCGSVLCACSLSSGGLGAEGDGGTDASMDAGDAMSPVDAGSDTGDATPPVDSAIDSEVPLDAGIGATIAAAITATIAAKAVLVVVIHFAT